MGEGAAHCRWACQVFCGSPTDSASHRVHLVLPIVVSLVGFLTTISASAGGVNFVVPVLRARPRIHRLGDGALGILGVGRANASSNICTALAHFGGSSGVVGNLADIILIGSSHQTHSSSVRPFEDGAGTSRFPQCKQRVVRSMRAPIFSTIIACGNKSSERTLNGRNMEV